MPEQKVPFVDRKGLTLGSLLLGLLLIAVVTGVVWYVMPSPPETDDAKPNPARLNESNPKPPAPKEASSPENAPAAEEAETGQQMAARIAETKRTIQDVENAAKLYAIGHDADFPESLDLLSKPEVINGVQKEPYLSKPPLDGWMQPIQYFPPQKADQSPLVMSYGPNQQEGGGDDITNQDEEFNPKETENRKTGE